MAAELGKKFTEHLFKLVDAKDYGGLAKLFPKGSISSFEGNNVQGQDLVKCLQMWNSKKYDKTQHGQFMTDTLPTLDGGNLILITGRRLDKEHPNQEKGCLFACTVVLKKGDSGFYIQNFIYRGDNNGKNVPSKQLGVGMQFAEQFYKIYDSEFKKLSGIYTDQSMMKYEGDEMKGVQQIMMKLIKGSTDKWEEENKGKRLKFKSVRFSSVKHELKSIDIHPGGGKNCLLVLVTGLLDADGGNQPRKFGEVFILANAKGWKVACQGFRQIY